MYKPWPSLYIPVLCNTHYHPKQQVIICTCMHDVLDTKLMMSFSMMQVIICTCILDKLIMSLVMMSLVMMSCSLSISLSPHAAYPDPLCGCSSRYHHRLLRLAALVSDTLTHEHIKKKHKTMHSQ